MSFKTMHLTNSFHGNSGGVRTSYIALLEAANRHRRPVRLLVPGAETRVEQIGEHARIYHLRAARGLSRLFDPSYRMILPHRYLLPPASEIWSILRQEKPDLIEISEKWATVYLAGLIRSGLVKGFRPRPVLVGMSCERMDDNFSAYLSSGDAGRRFSRWYMRQVYLPQFDYHLANSDYTAAELRAAATPQMQERISWQPRGVDSATFTPERRSSAIRDRWRARVGAGPKALLLVYAGRLSKEKNAGLLVDLMGRLVMDGRCDAHLLIAGDGPLRDSLIERADIFAPGRVHFLGHVASRARLADLLANADVFVHPNPREPFGIAPLEAMASGLPLVGPCAGGILSYATLENAWLVEPTPDAFAAAVREVTADPVQRGQKSKRARTTGEGHDWRQTTVSWFEAYDRLVVDFRSREAERARRSVGGAKTWKERSPAAHALKSVIRAVTGGSGLGSVSDR